MKLLKKLAVLGTAAAMCLSLTACGDTSWVYESGEYQVPSGVYLGYLTQAYLGGQSAEGFDEEISNIWKQKIGDKSYKDYCMEEAENQSKYYLTIAQKFDEMGLELTTEQNTSIDTQVYYMWALYGYQSVFEPNGTSSDSFRKMIETTVKESAIFEAYYGEGGIEEVSKDTLVDYMKSNYVPVNYYEFSFSDDNGAVLPDEEMEELKTTAENYAKAINDGEMTFNEAKTDYLDNLTKKNAEENGTEFTPTDPEKIAEDNDTATMLLKDSASPSEEFVKAAFEDVKVGASVITIGTSYYLVVKYDMNKDVDTYLEKANSEILSALKSEDFNKLRNQWTEAMAFNSNSSSISKYSPKNIKMPKE